ncbi:unnamed protein product [Phytomonas sp. Hart1]|nr:unnamed protein product [Phytomonas sp. Hart1]|eukprot:CCW70210.1 unnamed protein product [Phytomonas sp. isolate Hart1]
MRFDGSDFLKNKIPIKDYYTEALRKRKPVHCPICRHRGRLTKNLYEIGRRIPSVLTEGMAFCHICKEYIINQESRTLGDIFWYCELCEVCLCGRCQRKMD